MKKIAIVNQRYGLEVNGGSEYYTRLVAEHLSKYYEIDILTTTAVNYDTWENTYKEGAEKINGVNVRRFNVNRTRNMKKFRIISKLNRITNKFGITMDRIWIKEQGPYTPKLIQFIKEHKDDYDTFIFVTYLYYSTVKGLIEVADKSILIPTAHDEPYIHFPIYRELFKSPRGIIYLTEEEKQIVEKEFGNINILNDVIGVGIEIPPKLSNVENRAEEIENFREKYSIYGEYLIYAGRVDVGKNCIEMFKYFLDYKERYPESELKLVVIGKDMLGVPKHCDICYLGFVSEEDKYVGIAGAKCLWLPSLFESLSIALLEAMALGVPGIVNGNCEVLKGHCEKSKGALYYKSEEDFMKTMRQLSVLSKEDYCILSNMSKNYVEKYYNWSVVERKFVDIIDRRQYV